MEQQRQTGAANVWPVVRQETGELALTAPQAAILPRYERPPETASIIADRSAVPIPWDRVPAAVAASGLSPGAKTLLLALLRSGTVRVFPGGGVGIEYGSLLKTAARPDVLGAHIREAAAHLRTLRTDLLLVPGMSGYPVGSMYALAADLPAILLKKTRFSGNEGDSSGPGAFVIPSYTGEGDVLISADPAAVADIVAEWGDRQVRNQAGRPTIDLVLRCAGADDIIDKATMSVALGQSAVVIGEAAMGAWLACYRVASGDTRVATMRVEVVTWVTPLIKGYNRPQELLHQRFGVTPFAGLNILGLQLDPPALDVAGVGIVAFRQD